jgi:hypothetical protein
MRLVHEYYDWNALIDEHSRQRVCQFAKRGIDEGKFFENSPRYQTNWNFLGSPTEDFVNLKMSFIWSVFAFLGKEVSIKNIQSWCYMTNKDTAEDRDTLWHHHNHDVTTTTVSGVFYLYLPEDAKDLEQSGTELAPSGVTNTMDGPRSVDSYFAPWRTGHWMIYPGRIYHRPGILESSDNRFVIAADMEF